MSEADRARALAYLDAYPLMRRPGDPPVIPDERQDAADDLDGYADDDRPW
ncbi:hypothetical protein [Actinomadura rupiterrae]|nr:hypothetical protein [Actinomadura rupiterrae]MCP2337877.1 hypothetical protein [Actinomadura rupiterrae]